MAIPKRPPAANRPPAARPTETPQQRWRRQVAQRDAPLPRRATFRAPDVRGFVRTGEPETSFKVRDFRQPSVPIDPKKYTYGLEEGGRLIVRPRAGGPRQVFNLDEVSDQWEVREAVDESGVARRELVMRKIPQRAETPVSGYEAEGQQFGLPPGGPGTVRGKFAEFMGSPVTQAAMPALTGALPGAIVGTAIAPGIGTVVGGLLGYAMGWLAQQQQYENDSVGGRAIAALGGAAISQALIPVPILGAIPGAILGAAIGPRILDYPREAAERVAGTATQIGGAIAEPGKYGTFQEVIGNLGATWEAARSTYESAPVYVTGDRPVFPGSDQVFVDYDLPTQNGGLTALVEARRRIAAGESSDLVWAEMSQRFGAPGQIRELASGFFLDPLNFTGTIGRQSTKGFAKLIGDADLLQAARTVRRGGMVDVLNHYRNILITEKPFREGFNAAKDLTRFQRWVVGEELIKLAESGKYVEPKWFELHKLTPESSAKERVVQANNFLQAHILSRLDWANDPEAPAKANAMIRALKEADPAGLGALGGGDEIARAASTIEGRAIRSSLDVGAMDDVLKAWSSTTDERAALATLAARLDDTPENIIARISDGGDEAAARILDEYREAAGDVLRVGKNVADAKSVKLLGELFGDKEIPYSLDHFRAAFASRHTEAVGMWAAKTFSIKAPGFLERVAAAAKGAQSAVLLGLNPSYLVNNIINGEVTMAARGVWGLRGARAIMSDMERMGLSPARLAKGATAADLENFDPATMWGAVSAKAGIKPIAEAANYKGVLAEIRQRGGQLSSKMPATYLAQRAERWQSIRSFGEGMRQFRSMWWKRGKGFAKMSRALEDSLRAIDRRLPEYIYAAAEAGMNPTEIANKIFDAAPKPVVEAYHARLAASLGMSEDDVARLLAVDGIGDDLNTALAKLPARYRASDVRRVFDEARDTAERGMFEREILEYETSFKFASEAAKGGDTGQVLELADNVEHRLYETYANHMQELETEWDQILQVQQEDLRRLLIKAQRVRSEGTWKRFFDYEDATYRGMTDGLNQSGVVLDQNFLTSARAKRARTGKFFEERSKVLDDFFSLRNQTDAAWQTALERIDKAYSRTIKDLDDLGAAADRYMATEFARHYGQTAGDRFSMWREAVREFNKDDMRRVLEFRRSLRDVGDPVEKNRMWREFNAERIQRRKDIELNAIAARRRVSDTMKGRPGRGGGPPEPAQPLVDVGPGPRTPPRAGPAAAWVDDPTPDLPNIAGPEGTATVARGPDPTQTFDMRFRLVELDDLIASHDATGNPNAAYPATIQPRERGRLANVAQVNRIAQALDPSALLDDVHALDRGTPIIGADGVVESGNGRVAAMRLAAESVPERWHIYQADLVARADEFGFQADEIAAMRRPVLVRERTARVDRADFARVSNETPVAVMSATETAVADAARITDESIAALLVGEAESVEQALRSSGNYRFVRGFVDTMPENERGLMLQADGTLSQDGVRRLSAALFAKVYPGGAGLRLARALFESGDVNIRNVSAGMLGSLGDMARAESLTATGQRAAHFAIGADLAAAVDTLSALRARGQSVPEYLQQVLMFGDELSPFQKDLLADLDRLGRGSKMVRETLQTYARLVDESPVPGQGMLFVFEETSKPQLWRRAMGEKVEIAGEIQPAFRFEMPSELGRRVEVRSGGQWVEGVIAQVGPYGATVVRTPAGTVTTTTPAHDIRPVAAVARPVVSEGGVIPAVEPEPRPVPPAPVMPMPAPPAGPVSLAQMDVVSLNKMGWKGGAKHLFNAVNKDRGAAGLPKYTMPSEVPWTEAIASLNKRMPSEFVSARLNPDVKYYPGKLRIEKWPDLTPEQQLVEARFAAQIEADTDGMIAHYWKMKSDQGEPNVLNVDDIRELSDDYAAGRVSRQTLAAAIHEPSSALAKEIYRRRLTEPVTGVKRVTFLAGGGGSGKTSATKNVEAAKALLSESHLVWDQTMGGAESAMRRMDQALEQGFDVSITMVYRDPIDSMINGVVPRAEMEGRAVPVAAFVGAHVNAPKVVRQIAERYAGNEHVQVNVIDNTRGFGKAALVDIDFLADVPYTETDALRTAVLQALEREWKNGNPKLTKGEYRAITGADPPGRSTHTERVAARAAPGPDEAVTPEVPRPVGGRGVSPKPQPRGRARRRPPVVEPVSVERGIVTLTSGDRLPAGLLEVITRKPFSAVREAETLMLPPPRVAGLLAAPAAVAEAIPAPAVAAAEAAAIPPMRPIVGSREMHRRMFAQYWRSLESPERAAEVAFGPKPSVEERLAIHADLEAGEPVTPEIIERAPGLAARYAPESVPPLAPDYRGYAVVGEGDGRRIVKIESFRDGAFITSRGLRFEPEGLIAHAPKAGDTVMVEVGGRVSHWVKGRLEWVSPDEDAATVKLADGASVSAGVTKLRPTGDDLSPLGELVAPIVEAEAARITAAEQMALPFGEIAVPERPIEVTADLAPFEVGLRVLMPNGRRGEIVGVDPVETRQLYGPLFGSEPAGFRYRIRSDNGTEYTYAHTDIGVETAPRAAAVVPDPMYRGKPIEPDDLAGMETKFLQDAQNATAKANRSKGKSWANRSVKAALLEEAAGFRQKADEARAAWDEWARQYPDESAKYRKLEPLTDEARRDMEKAARLTREGVERALSRPGQRRWTDIVTEEVTPAEAGAIIEEGGQGVRPEPTEQLGAEYRPDLGEPEAVTRAEVAEVGGVGAEGAEAGGVVPTDVLGLAGRGEPEPGAGVGVGAGELEASGAGGVAPVEAAPAAVPERPFISPEVSQPVPEVVPVTRRATRFTGDRGNDYRITDADEIGAGGKRTKFWNNVEAIKLLKELESTGRRATPEEQAILVKYSGWGGIKEAFDQYQGLERWNGDKPEWFDEYNAVHDLLDHTEGGEYDLARASTKNAHYTSPEVIRAMWSAVRRLGFDGGRVLEPSAGIGHFFGLMPEDLFARSARTAVEIDSLTARILKQLYQTADVHAMGYQETRLPKGYYDLVISNVPFGKEFVADADFLTRPTYTHNSIHNYFFAKAGDHVRPGGLVAFITSSFTMDGASHKPFREWLGANDLDFVDAIRLPHEAFEKNAGTSVLTDIIFMRKRGPGEAPASVKWLGVIDHRAQDGKTYKLNEWYADHPDRIMGEIGEGTMYARYGSDQVEMTVNLPEGASLAVMLDEAIGKLPENIYRAEVRAADDVATVTRRVVGAQRDKKVGGYYLDEAGKARQYTAEGTLDEIAAPDEIRADPKRLKQWNEDQARIGPALRVKEAYNETRQAMIDGADDQALAAKQRGLNDAYDRFVKKYGPLSSKRNRMALADDPEYPALLALETKYDKQYNTAEKAAIFRERTIPLAQQMPTTAATARDALGIVLAHRGRVDVDGIAKLRGIGVDEAIDELGDLVFKDPEGDWLTADEYLSGNVREKLRVAESIANSDPSFQRNAEALRQVIPENISHERIYAPLGAGWIPRETIAGFMSHLFGKSVDADALSYNPELSLWSIGKEAGENNAARVTWAAGDRNAADLISGYMNSRSTKIYETITNPDGSTSRRLDTGATLAARETQSKINAEFQKWLWADEARRDGLVRLFNEKFNTNVLREFDGRAIYPEARLPNMSTDIPPLHDHQLNTIWRGVQQKNMLMAHAVGAGKTRAMIGTGMELKRLGLRKKVAYVVPNATYAQFIKQFHQMYPGASLLTIGAKDFGNEAARSRALASIATGNYDAVIVPHSTFTLLSVSDDTYNSYLLEQIAVLKNYLEEIQAEQAGASGYGRRGRAQADNGKRRMVKQLESSIQKMTDDLRFSGDEAKLVDDVMEYVGKGNGSARKNGKKPKNQVAAVERAVGNTKERIRETRLRLGLRQDVAVTWDDLGIDQLFVDEAHEFKNLFFPTKMEGVKGLGASANAQSSQRAMDMFVKVQELQRRGGGVVFSTGTPLTNSGAEMFTMLRYLAYDKLREQGLLHFDAWAKQFAEVDTILERNITGTQWKDATRLARFKNGVPLMRQFLDVADVRTQNMIKLPLPEHSIENVTIPPSPEMIAFSRELDARIKNLSPDNRAVDNMLKIGNDGRSASIDMRLIDSNSPDYPDSKVNRVVSQVLEDYRATSDYKGTQLVFVDWAIHKKGDRISVYDDIRAKLVANGIPRDQIAFVHDFPNKTDADLQKLVGLFEKVNAGEVRVVLGSTKRLGVGVNVQHRLYSIHHVDAPWRPSDIGQREGRILRQGNLHYTWKKPVKVYRYLSENSFDSFLWQTLKTKAEMIEQVMSGRMDLDVFDDPAGAVGDFNMSMVASWGDPRAMEKIKVDNEFMKLALARDEHFKQQASFQRQIRLDENEVQTTLQTIEHMRAVTAKFKSGKPDPFTAVVGGVRYDKITEAGAAMLARITEAIKGVKDDDLIPLAEYAGFEIYLKPIVAREGVGSFVMPNANIVWKAGSLVDTELVKLADLTDNKLAHMLRTSLDYTDRIQTTVKQVEMKRGRVEALKAEIGKAFDREAELVELRVKKVELDEYFDNLRKQTEGGETVVDRVEDAETPEGAEMGGGADALITGKDGEYPADLHVGDLVDTTLGKVYIERVDADGIHIILPTGVRRVIPYKGNGDAPLPPGVLSDLGSLPMPVAEGMESAWAQNIRPLLNTLERNIVDDAAAPPVRGAGAMDAATRAELDKWVAQTQAKMGEASLLSMKWGEYKRDAALLNYDRRYRYNTYLGMVAPYEFWMTQSMVKWALHSLDRPAILANYYRINKFLNTQVTKPGFPSRLKGRIKIPLPFLPEWMGGGIWVDPTRIGLPIQSWIYPWDDWANHEAKLDGRAERVLQDMVEAGEVAEADARAASRAKSGALWDQAIAEAQEQDKSLRRDAYDLASAVMAPSLPLAWAINALRGTPERIGPLPATRYIRALSAALGVGGPGGVNIEEGIRRQLGLPIFDQWSDYRVDRELSNMAAEGLIASDQAKEAMVSRQGVFYDLAVQREAQAAAAQTLAGGALGVPASVYPEGEQRQRALGLLFSAAWRAEANGDTEALSRFFEEFPEYEARLALYDDKEGRLRNFMIDRIWNAYMELPRVYKDDVAQALGNEFEQAFLNRETRAYDTIPVDTLQRWAVTLGYQLPSADAQPLPVDWAPPAVAMGVEEFYDTRDQLFDMDPIYALQDMYFAIPQDARVGVPTPRPVRDFMEGARGAFPGIEAKLAQYKNLHGKVKSRFRKDNPDIGAYFDALDVFKSTNPDLKSWFKSGLVRAKTQSARSDFLDGAPELKEYWDWRKAYLEDHPWVGAYIEEKKKRDAPAPWEPEGAPSFTPELNRLVTAYLFTGRPLTPAARKKLEGFWQESGAGGTFESWLMMTVAQQQGAAEPIQ